MAAPSSSSSSSSVSVGSAHAGPITNSTVGADRADRADRAPDAPPLVSNPNAILVSEKQKGNPLLRFVRLCPWEYSKEIVPDYVMGTTCAIFISLKFHILHPKHVEMRIR
jgi:DNA excision repair protein ERCC-1